MVADLPGKFPLLNIGFIALCSTLEFLYIQEHSVLRFNAIIRGLHVMHWRGPHVFLLTHAPWAEPKGSVYITDIQILVI